MAQAADERAEQPARNEVEEARWALTRAQHALRAGERPSSIARHLTDVDRCLQALERDGRSNPT